MKLLVMTRLLSLVFSSSTTMRTRGRRPVPGGERPCAVAGDDEVRRARIGEQRVERRRALGAVARARERDDRIRADRGHARFRVGQDLPGRHRGDGHPKRLLQGQGQALAGVERAPRAREDDGSLRRCRTPASCERRVDQRKIREDTGWRSPIQVTGCCAISRRVWAYPRASCSSQGRARRVASSPPTARRPSQASTRGSRVEILRVHHGLPLLGCPTNLDKPPELRIQNESNGKLTK